MTASAPKPEEDTALNKLIRAIAIVAHVDHGKTTLVDSLLRQGSMIKSHQEVDTCVMDSNDLEKERGITILAKVTSIVWQNEKINVIDTPGHADFGGEVERIMSLTDHILLVIDSVEGPMPQTRFVLEKALSAKKSVIIVINKADKPEATRECIEATYYSAVTLIETLSNGDIDAFSIPVFYASGRDGWAVKEIDEIPRTKEEKEKLSLAPLFEAIMKNVVPAPVYPAEPFRMVAIMFNKSYLGSMIIGRASHGTVKVNDEIHSICKNDDGTVSYKSQGRVIQLFTFWGLETKEVQESTPGDIIGIVGMKTALLTETLGHLTAKEPLDSPKLDKPTLAMMIYVNRSALAGKDGKKLTTNLIHQRLKSEIETNSALTLEVAHDGDGYRVSGRGELQLGILLENMRREGFEIEVGAPVVITKKDAAGNVLEPVEEVQFDIPDGNEEYKAYVFAQIEKRRGVLMDSSVIGNGRYRILARMPSRCLMGFSNAFTIATSGAGIMSRSFFDFEPYYGALYDRSNGYLISTSGGFTTEYALGPIEARGTLFVGAREEVYPGMLVGYSSTVHDVHVNPTKPKQLTNIRTTGTDEAVFLQPPIRVTIERGLSMLTAFQRMEITPNHVRIYFPDPKKTRVA